MKYPVVFFSLKSNVCLVYVAAFLAQSFESKLICILGKQFEKMAGKII